MSEESDIFIGPHVGVPGREETVIEVTVHD
jgi:hypothetical protein